ncbi:hypothetical protein CBM2625_A140099 [Cupriavidus taiwanensis]|nr:hypothetical protein CBM2625_A140099 [Cupriavidus taiwanensis]
MPVLVDRAQAAQDRRPAAGRRDCRAACQHPGDQRHPGRQPELGAAAGLHHHLCHRQRAAAGAGTGHHLAGLPLHLSPGCLSGHFFAVRAAPSYNWSVGRRAPRRTRQGQGGALCAAGWLIRADPLHWKRCCSSRNTR